MTANVTTVTTAFTSGPSTQSVTTATTTATITTTVATTTAASTTTTPTTSGITATTQSVVTPGTSTIQRMANLSQADLTGITDIVAQNAQKDDGKIRQFIGLQKEAVSWMEDYEYIVLSNNWNDDKKIVKLGAYLTGSGREWYSLYVQGQQNLTWALVKDLFFKQFLPVDYASHLRDQFRTRKQKLYEPSANYIVAMRSLLTKSGQTMTEQEAVDYIISNVQTDIRKELRLKKTTTYVQLMETANTIEFALKSSQGQDDEELKSIANQLAAISFNNNNNPNNYQNNYQSQQQRGGGRGNNRSYRGNNQYATRSQRGSPRCWNCRRVGHVWTNCRSLNNAYFVSSRFNDHGGNRGNNRGWRRPRGGFRGRGRGNNQYQSYGYQQNQNVNAVEAVVTHQQPISGQLALPEPTQQFNSM